MSSHHCTLATRPLNAVVSLPGSKSITNRALITAALADGTSRLSNLLLSDDTRLMIAALQALGIVVTLGEGEETAEIEGCRGALPARRADLFCGNSGTTIRFCAALVALGQGRYSLDGVERMRQRPLGGLVTALRGLGASVEYTGRSGCPPIVIEASGIAGGEVDLDSPESSQFISALLLAAPEARAPVVLNIRGAIPSSPYLAMTLAVMRCFGIEVREEPLEKALRYKVPAPGHYHATEMMIEPDASNATYFLAAAAVAGGSVTVRHLGTESIQGDARFVDLLERMGCAVQRFPDRLKVEGPSDGARLRGIDVDLNDMPDTVQTLAVLALFAEGPTTIRNVASLRVKETDRLAALRQELTRLGASVDESDAGLVVHPPAKLLAPAVQTYDDHRMAMSFALAGLRIPGLVLDGADCCSKTFPDFFERFDGMLVRQP